MSKEVNLYNLFFNDFSPQRPYEQWKDAERTTVHYGQIKLMLADISFLTIFWDPKQVKYPQVVIVGAAPGQHYPILVKMFPDLTFHLYDPREFLIPSISRERITLYQQFFTDEDAEKWKGRDDVIFISDIRSISDDTPTEEYEGAVKEDMIRQQKWVETINPIAASLKFRLPYPTMNQETGFYDVDILTEYLDGFRMKQIFAPQTSTEVRLVPIKVDGKYRKKIWSAVLHQDQCFFHNRHIRTSEFFNPFTLDMTPIWEEELTNDFDSVAAMLVLMSYIHRMTGEVPTPENGIALYRVILQDINNHRSSVLTITQLRQSEWKSSVNAKAKDKKWMIKMIPRYQYTYKPLIYIVRGDEPKLAPAPIELLA